eukprot:s1348_g16.t1
MQQNEAMIRVVKVGADEFSTLDDYGQELDLEKDVPENEFWCDEDEIKFNSTTVEKVVAYFECFFGPARAQKIPCDGAIQNEDSSQMLSAGDSKAYRSVIGAWNSLSATKLSNGNGLTTKIRRLSGEISWMQSMVLEKQANVGQVPIQWNYSDIGAKPLSKNRFLVLLSQIGACDPVTFQSVGEEEFNAVSELLMGEQKLNKVAKTIFRMAAVWGLESAFPTGADAIPIEKTCASTQASAAESEAGGYGLQVSRFSILDGFCRGKLFGVAQTSP